MREKRPAVSIVLATMACLIFSGCLALKSETSSKQPDSDRLQIGWAKRSIAVPGNVPITGQMHLRIAQGEYSPILASALAISNSKDSVIFVALDVVSANSYILEQVIGVLKK